MEIFKKYIYIFQIKIEWFRAAFNILLLLYSSIDRCINILLNEYFLMHQLVSRSKKTMSNENELTSRTSWKVSQFVQLARNKQISGGIELADEMVAIKIIGWREQIGSNRAIKITQDHRATNHFCTSEFSSQDGLNNETTGVEIKVADIQNSPPEFLDSLTGVVREDDPIGTLVMTVKARDGDRGMPRKMIYELVTSESTPFSFAKLLLPSYLC